MRQGILAQHLGVGWSLFSRASEEFGIEVGMWGFQRFGEAGQAFWGSSGNNGSLPSLVLHPLLRLEVSIPGIVGVPMDNCRLTIPVRCVGQGRWAYRSQKFASGEKVMPPSMRREHQKIVAIRLNAGVGCWSNQGMIWNEIAMKSEHIAAHSATGAMVHLFDGQKHRLGEYLKTFRLVDCQIGAVSAISGEVVGLECFGDQLKPSVSFFPNWCRATSWMPWTGLDIMGKLRYPVNL